MYTNFQAQSSPIEGYFRRSKQTVFWIILFSIAVVVGGAVIIIGMIEQQIFLVIGAIIIIIAIGAMTVRQQKQQLVKVTFSNGQLLIKGGGYHIQMQEPFRYQTGVERIRATRRAPEFHYVRMVLDVYGKPLVLEEQVPSGIQPPKLEEIIGVSSALGIAELSSVNQYPGTLWSIIAHLEKSASQVKRDQVQRDIESLYRIGGQQLNAGHYAEAIKMFSEIIRLTPDSPYPYYNRGMARYYERRDFVKAATDLTTALRLNPKFDRAYRMRGLVKAEQGDWAGLRDDCTFAIKLNPNDGELYNMRGGACFRLKDFQAAIADFDRAIELDDTKPEPFHNRGLVKQRLGHLDGALDDFRQALILNPVFELARKSIEQVQHEKQQLGLG